MGTAYGGASEVASGISSAADKVRWAKDLKLVDAQTSKTKEERDRAVTQQNLDEQMARLAMEQKDQFTELIRKTAAETQSARENATLASMRRQIYQRYPQLMKMEVAFGNANDPISSAARIAKAIDILGKDLK